MTQDDVLFSEKAGKNGNLGIITLNRPHVLNSINHTMVRNIYQQLMHWRDASSIKAVVITAAPGRAFCAGGDLRSTYDRYKAHDPTLAEFFRDEYRLNKAIHHFPKPYIALWDGITMGGGVGLSIHGSHRVATEKLLFAMPETGIGFFPDVGGTYFLPKLPQRFGWYLGLTGARLNAAEALHVGIATHFVSQNRLPEVIERLASEDYSDNPYQGVTDIIKQCSTPLDTALLEEQLINALAPLLKASTLEELIENFKNSTLEIAQTASVELQKKSPTSLKVTWIALQDHANLNFDECMQQEFRMACRFLQAHDFAEGIRALIIDKDQKPQWQPSTLNAVSPLEVASYFAPELAKLE